MPIYPRNGPIDVRLYPLDGQTTPTITADDIRPKICRPNRPILFPTGRTHIIDSLSGVAADVRLSQGTRSTDGIFESSPDVPAAEYRHIVSQPAQMPYNRYGLLSCQGHAVRPPWGIVLPRIWINSDDLTTHVDLTVPDDLTTLQLSAPLMAGPYRILL